jgi:hypothetical protein
VLLKLNALLTVMYYCRARKVESLRVAKAVEKAVELRTQRAEREGDKAERKRLAALKANDMDAYRYVMRDLPLTLLILLILLLLFVLY